MHEHHLRSLTEYSHFAATLLDRADILSSTLAVWSDSPWTGTAEGDVSFRNGLRLRIREEIDFHAGLITSYGYEIYNGNERLYWYDDFPHPRDPELAATHPHHKHIPPDIKHHRVPAPGLSFTTPNLPLLLQELEELSKSHP